MPTQLLRAALLGSAASVLALSGAAVPVRAAGVTGWHVRDIISVPGDSVQLNSVAAVSATDAWAAGGIAPAGLLSFQPLIMHWNGAAWQRMSLPGRILATLGTGQGLSVIRASRGSGVWAFDGLAGSWLHRAGSHWTAGRLPVRGAGSSRPVISAAVVISRANVWAFGFAVTAAGRVAPYAAHLRRGIWRLVALPGAGAVTAASAFSRASMWALTSGGPQTGTANALAHWNGRQWSPVSLPASLATGARLYSVLAAGPDSAWAGGGRPAGSTGPPGAVALWKAGAWQVWRLRRMTTSEVNVGFHLAAGGHGGCWAAAAGSGRGNWRMWHYTGGQWTRLPAVRTAGRHAYLGDVARVPRTASLWAVGERTVGHADQGVIAGYGPAAP